MRLRADGGRLLRLSGLTLERPAHVQSDRKRLRDRPTQGEPLKGMPLGQDRVRHGVRVADEVPNIMPRG
jgi:hypothetical protein